MGNVRGIFFLDYVRMLRRSGSQNLAQHLQPADLELLHQQIDVGAWYPMETFERFGLAILAEVVGHDLEAARLWGQAQIPQILTFFADLKAQGDPRDTILRFATLMGSLFDYPAVTVDRVHDGEALIRIDYGMSARAEEAASWQTCGFFEALAEAAGGTGVRGSFAREAWKAGPPTQLLVVWS
jgi:hypothetical protein